MKKDILSQKVEDTIIAIVPRGDHQEGEEELWDTYLINLKKQPITSVLVSSKGYGKLDGEKMKTTTLRHFFEEIAPEVAIKVEPIQARLFDITNEYWVSFSHNNFMFDKKYIFVKGSITEKHFTMIPIVGRKGVMIK
ncbi:MAG: hypothetical protein AB8G22_11650 [Saprospiraceae bacterium]